MARTAHDSFLGLILQWITQLGPAAALLMGSSFVLAQAPEVAPPGSPPTGLLCLTDAYSDHLEGPRWIPGEGWALAWKDGTLMDWDDERGDKDFDTLLNDPDLEDMMSMRYTPGVEYSPPDLNDDPGRIRYDPFFRKIYGNSSKEIRSRLEKVRWMPSSGGRSLRAMSVNGVHVALARVSDALEKLPRKIRKMAAKTSGPFNWRVIKGTKRLSAHSFAIALDVAVENAHYWRWTRPDKDGHRPYRNKIPLEIVEAFEHQGFIWGGKWYHYDTMHFEYRPELLDPRCIRSGETRNSETSP